MLHQVIAVTGLERCRVTLKPNDVVVCAGDAVAAHAATMTWPEDCEIYCLDTGKDVGVDSGRGGRMEGLPITTIGADQWVQLAVECELNMVWT